MPTALTYITDAMKLIGALAQGQPVEAEEGQDGLRRLNAMLGQWRLERLMLFATQRAAFPLTAGQATYTYGDGGDWDAPRPVRIERVSFLHAQGTEHPGRVLTEAEYQRITRKTQPGWPFWIYPDYAFPLMNVETYPVPQAGGLTQAVLYVWSQLERFATISTNVEFPDGYDAAISFNLAIHIAPYYDRPVSEEIRGLALSTKARIKIANTRVPKFRLDPALMRRRRYSIHTDGGG